MIAERLSRITHLSLLSYDHFHPNTLKLISEYFTGLKSFNVNCYLKQICQNEVTFNTIMDIFCCANEDSCIRGYGTEFIGLTKYLTIIMQKLFRPPSNRVLRVIVNLSRSSKWLDLNIRLRMSEPTVVLTINDDTGNALNLFKSDTPLTDVDVCILTIENKGSHHINTTLDNDAYENILKECIPSLKKVVFDTTGLQEDWEV